MIRNRFVPLCFACCLVAAPIALAQDGEPATSEQPQAEEQPQPAEQQPPKARLEQRGDTSTVVGSALANPDTQPRFTVRGGYRLQFESDFDSAPGDFSVNRALFGVTMAGRMNETVSYSLDLQAEHSSYDFSAASALAPGTSDPLDDALAIIFTPSFRFAIDDQWAARLGGAIIASGETDANVDDSLRFSVFGGIEHKLSDSLTLSILAVVWSRLEDDAEVFPIIGISWQVNELMRVQTRGLGAELVSDLGNDWSLGFRGAWEYREYRLSDESSAPLPEGVLRDSGVILSLELAWSPSPDVVLAIEGGGVVAQELEFLNRNGGSVSKTDADPAFFVGVRASFAF